MLASSVMSPLGMDKLEKLPVGSLNNICERVRLALLHVFLPRLCDTCKSSFSAAFQKSQSTVLLLRSLCETCKCNYIKDRRAAARKKHHSLATATFTPSSTGSTATSTKLGAKKKSRSQATGDTEFSGSATLSTSSLATDELLSLPRPKKIRLVTTTGEMDVPRYALPLTPPPDATECPTLSSTTCGTEEISASVAAPVPATFTAPPLRSDEHIYAALSEAGMHWCRYCGVAGHVNSFWKLGPWGERTLCHKHGCEFLGCGFARATTTRLDLTAFHNEGRETRTRPVIQDYCAGCWEHEDAVTGPFLRCHGCPQAFHEACLRQPGHVHDDTHWYCSSTCPSHFATRKVHLQLPSKARPPFVCRVPHIDPAVILQDADQKHPPRLTLRISLNAFPRENAVSTAASATALHKKRKYRKHDRAIADRVMVFVPVKVDQSVHVHADISTPRWTVKSLEERRAYDQLVAVTEDDIEAAEDLEDEALLLRHARYEEAERCTRLLKPGVLTRLANGEEVGEK